jgi:3-hydroxyacyl-CoA dehydrogenase
VLELADGYQPPAPVEYRLPGPSGARALEMAVDGFVASGKATPHDRTVSFALAEVLSGGTTDVTRVMTEDEVLALERAQFGRLVRMPQTLARIEHMLETGKPLRN